jgi:hypothetical protein
MFLNLAFCFVLTAWRSGLERPRRHHTPRPTTNQINRTWKKDKFHIQIYAFIPYKSIKKAGALKTKLSVKATLPFSESKDEKKERAPAFGLLVTMV